MSICNSSNTISSFPDFYARQKVLNCTAQKCFSIHSLSNTFRGSYFQKRCLLTVLADVCVHGTQSSKPPDEIHSFGKVRNAFVKGCWKLVEIPLQLNIQIMQKSQWKTKQNTSFSLGVFFLFLQQTTSPLYSGSPTGWSVSRPYALIAGLCHKRWDPPFYLHKSIGADFMSHKLPPATQV